MDTNLTPQPSPALSDRLAAALAGSGVPGAVVGVATPVGVEIGVAGVASLRTGFPVTPDTLFQVGSITKTFTSTCVLRLADAGRLGLDDRLVEHLPEFRLAGPSGGGDITVRHVLAHVAGIPSDHFEPFGRGDDCLERLVADLARLRPEHAPGATFSYSNAGFSVLGRLVERLTGRVFDRALRELVLDPLGLPVATLLPEEAILHPVAVGHHPDVDGPPGVVPVFASASRAVGPEGLLMLPVAELLAFATGVGRLLRPETLAEAHRPQVSVRGLTRESEAWGLGWAVYRSGPGAVVGHDGEIGGQTARLRVVPDRGISVALLTNLAHCPGSAAVHREVVGGILRDLTGSDGEPEIPRGEPPLDDPRRYAGRYGRLNATWTVEPAPSGGLVASVEVGEAILADGGADLPPTPLVPVERDVFTLGSELPPTWVVFNDVGADGRAGRLFTGHQANHRLEDDVPARP